MVAISMSFIGCNDDEESIVEMEDITNNVTCSIIESDTNTFEIISSNETLQELCSHSPIVDFSRYSVIHAYGIVHGGTCFDCVTGQLHCDNGAYILTVNIQQTDATVTLSYWEKYFLVKKIKTGTKMSLIVNYSKK